MVDSIDKVWVCNRVCEGHDYYRRENHCRMFLPFATASSVGTDSSDSGNFPVGAGIRDAFVACLG